MFSFIEWQVVEKGLSCSCGKVTSRFISNITDHLEEAHPSQHKTFLCELCSFSCQKSHNKLWGHLSEEAHEIKRNEKGYRKVTKLRGPQSARNATTTAAASETSDTAIRSGPSTPRSQASGPRSEASTPRSQVESSTPAQDDEPMFTFSVDRYRWVLTQVLTGE